MKMLKTAGVTLSLRLFFCSDLKGKHYEISNNH
jgi:hypothetical protein